MTSSRWQLVLIKCKYEPKIIPFLLAAVRLLICFWPQTGYLHPDEFFQSTDITGGLYFSSKVQPVWEFITDKPIRCMLIPNLLNSIAFKLATIFQSSPSAYLLLVMPRFIYTLTSFIIDGCLYKLCRYYSSRGLWYLPVSIVFQTSFICLGCLTRTFSNVTEAIIFSLLLVVVCQLIRPRFRIMFVTPTRSTPTHERVKASKQLASSILVGVLVTLGTFNRPTFPCFAIVPMLYWLNESFRRNSYNARLNIQRVLVPVAIASSLTAILLIAYDTFYYKGAKALVDLVHLLRESKFTESYKLIQSSWVVTPYNFIRYNSNIDNLTKYGLHSPYMHMAVNIPFAFNVLGLMFFGKLVSLMIGSGVYRLIFSTHRIYALMLLSVLTATILLSFIPHQEFRFLIPLIVPLTYAFAYNIYASNAWLTIWLLCNILITYFYSSVHHAGPMRASLDLDPILKEFAGSDAASNRTLIDVLAFRCYLVPSYQWNIPSDDYRFKFNLQDTIEDFNESLHVNLGSSLDRQAEHYKDHSLRLYIMSPNIHVKHLNNFIIENYSQNFTRLNVIKQYLPHYSGEELGNSVAILKQFGIWTLNSWREAFGFSLLQTDLINFESLDNS